MIKSWEVTAELNMNAAHYETVVIKANTERKAKQFAEAYFKKNGAFFVTNITAKQLNS